MFILYWIFCIFRLRLMRLTVFIAFLNLTVAHLSTNLMQKLPFLRTEEQKGKYLFKSFESKLFAYTSITVKLLYYYTKYLFIQKKMVFLIWRISWKCEIVTRNWLTLYCSMLGLGLEIFQNAPRSHNVFNKLSNNDNLLIIEKLSQK